MQVGGEQQRNAEDGQKVADHDALLALGRIDGGDEAEAELLGDHGARDRQRRNGDAGGGAEDQPDQDFVHQQHRQRRQVLQIDLIGAPMQRQQDERERQRNAEPDADRNVHLAEPRHQHDHGADAGEHQQEGGGKRRKERNVDAHASRPTLGYWGPTLR